MNKDFKAPKFYIVRLLEDFNAIQNDMKYIKGIDIIVSEDMESNCYWVANTNDNIPLDIATKIYEFTLKEL